MLLLSEGENMKLVKSAWLLLVFSAFVVSLSGIRYSDRSVSVVFDGPELPPPGIYVADGPELPPPGIYVADGPERPPPGIYSADGPELPPPGIYSDGPELPPPGA